MCAACSDLCSLMPLSSRISRWPGLEKNGILGPLLLPLALGVVGAILVLVSGATIVSFHYLGLLRAAGHPQWLASVLLVTELVAVVFIGLFIAIVITLTDDLVAPIMYADKISLPAAWRIVWKMSRRDPRHIYLLRGVALCGGNGSQRRRAFGPFPDLDGIIFRSAGHRCVGIFALRIVGLVWAWNPVTIILAPSPSASSRVVVRRTERGGNARPGLSCRITVCVSSPPAFSSGGPLPRIGRAGRRA